MKFSRCLALTALLTAARTRRADGLASVAQAQDRLKFKVIGQPLATGLIQKNKEQPFFENFAKRPGCRSTPTTSRSTRWASRTPSSCA